MHFDPTKAERALKFINHLKLTGDFHGQPFKFEAWNRKIVYDVYGTLNERGFRQYRDVYVELPKKNTKSLLGCNFCLEFLFNKQKPNGLIYFAGADKENARETLYQPLVEIIDQEPSLVKRVKITDSLKEIVNKETGTRLKVLSSDVANKHGPNASLTIMDEIHSWHGRALYDILTHGTGLARRDPLRIVLTTAGDDPDRVTIGWELHERAQSVIDARKPGGDISKDIPTLYPVIFSYDGDDIWNEQNWYKANPMLDIVFPVEALRELAVEAKLNPAKERLFRWLNLNQWTTTKLSGWLPIQLFDSTIGTWSRADLLGLDCYLGGDFSTTTDLSAICLIFPPQEKNGKRIDDWRVIWDCWIPEETMSERAKEDHVPYDKWAAAGWIHATPGNQIDYDTIEERIWDLSKMYNILECGMDLSFATMLIQHLQKKAPKQDWVVETPQQYSYMTDPINFVEILLRQKRTVISEEDETEQQFPMLTHEANPVARWCFGNASIAMNGNEQKKLVKERRGKHLDRTKRIDLTIALVNGMARARTYLDKVDLSEILNDDWGM